ncbi:hypothetical protein D9M68_936420 [compost metagenome]
MGMWCAQRFGGLHPPYVLWTLRRPVGYIGAGFALTLALSQRERGLSGVAGWHGIHPDANVPPLPPGDDYRDVGVRATQDAKAEG